MREFFRGWKRKVGVVTLVVACVFMAGWVRSLSTEDLFGIELGGLNHLFGSSSQQIMWQQHRIQSESPQEVGFIDGWSSRAIPHPTEVVLNGSDWNRKLIGFEIDFGHFELAGVTAHAFVEYKSIKIPYWSLIIPLTALSALLLLSKPRVAKTTPVAELEPRSWVATSHRYEGSWVSSLCCSFAS